MILCNFLKCNLSTEWYEWKKRSNWGCVGDNNDEIETKEIILKKTVVVSRSRDSDGNDDDDEK